MNDGCHNPQCSRACWTYFPWPQTRCVDPRSILVEQCTMPDEATKVGMRNTDAHVCVPSLFSSQRVYIYPTSTGHFPSLEINYDITKHYSPFPSSLQTNCAGRTVSIHL